MRSRLACTCGLCPEGPDGFNRAHVCVLRLHERDDMRHLSVPVRVGRARMRGVHVMRAIIIFHGSEEGPRPGHQDCEVGECRTRCSRGSNTVVVLAWGGLAGGRWRGLVGVGCWGWRAGCGLGIGVGWRVG